jgi:transglutaminase-like putative cysteine protease
MIFAIAHLTRYRYTADVTELQMELRLRPPSGGGQAVHAHRLVVRPETPLRHYVDGFGNPVHYFNLLASHDQLEVVSETLVETNLPAETESLDVFPADLLVFRRPVVDVAGVRRLARETGLRDPESGEDVRDALQRLTGAIARGFRYSPDITTVSTSVDEVLKLRQGVCQDFAHLFIAAARAMGIPCRYVSGYVYAGRGEPVVGTSHAWAEAWVPQAGWSSYDPTHPGLSFENYVRLAFGRDYRDAAPTRGVYMGSASSELEVRVEIRRLGSVETAALSA